MSKQSVTAATPSKKALLKSTAKEVRKDLSLYAVIGLLVSAVYAFFALNGRLEHLSLSMYALFISEQFSLTLKVLVLLYLCSVVAKRSASPISLIISDISKLSSNPHKLIAFTLFCGATSILLSAFTSMKAEVGVIEPFLYDELFHFADKRLHLGYLPWELTHAVFQSPYFSFVMNVLYNLWFVLVFLFYVVVFLRNDKYRTTILISYVMCWVIMGGFGAVYLSSAGPCFVDEFLGARWYETLFDRLNAQNQVLLSKHNLDIWALNTQQLLFTAHTSDSKLAGVGISAMPSMHVALATLMWLGCRTINRKIGIVALLYLIAIQVGSVHLGWHYALDGYISILSTTALFYLVSLFNKKAPVSTKASN